MELLILSSLEWKMHPATPLSFIDHIIRRLGMRTHQHWEFFGRCERLLLSLITGRCQRLSSTHQGYIGAGKAETQVPFKTRQPERSLRCFKRMSPSEPGSPKGVFDASFNSDGTNDSWVSSSASSSSSPMGLHVNASKKSRIDDQHQISPFNQIRVVSGSGHVLQKSGTRRHDVASVKERGTRVVRDSVSPAVAVERDTCRDTTSVEFQVIRDSTGLACLCVPTLFRTRNKDTSPGTEEHGAGNVDFAGKSPPRRKTCRKLRQTSNRYSSLVPGPNSAFLGSFCSETCQESPGIVINTFSVFWWPESAPECSVVAGIGEKQRLIIRASSNRCIFLVFERNPMILGSLDAEIC
ncbi:hypothetical protein EJ110_NYTH53712 [Nymphaea thermarum]|nr:hypothetical protein EJ110_NYTH53712 [Nymphaea thermarum]